MADNRKFPSVLAKRLKTDISATDTTFKLPDILWYTGSDGVDVNLSSSDFGSVAYGVWEPNTSRQEFFTWDPTTIANYATTGLSILARGLPWSADYTTEASSRKWGHDGGTKVLLMTNAPDFYNQFANKNNEETIANVWTFTSTVRPKYDTHPTFVADEELIDKKYADDLAIAGSPDGSTTVKGIFEEATVAEQGTATATGVTGARLVVANANLIKVSSGASDENKIAVLNAAGKFADGFLDSARTWTTVQTFSADNLQITSDANSANDAVRSSYLDTVVPKGAVSGTSGEAITAGQGVYLKASDGKLWKTVGSANESTFSFVGVALTTVGAADLTVTYAPPGHTVTGLAGLTAGSYYFITDTAGTLSTTPGTRFARVGIAVSATALLVTLPKYVVSGSFSYVNTDPSPLTTQTVGFYPALVQFRSTASGSNSALSIGDSFSQTSVSVGFAPNMTSNAWYLNLNGSGTLATGGGIGTRTATGFTPTHSTVGNPGTVTVQWTAESL